MTSPVRNVPATGGERCSCHDGVWIWHHEEITGSKQSICSVYGCGNQAEVGGHVWFAQGTIEYIVPLCHSCNRIPCHESFDLKDWVLMAFAYPSEGTYRRHVPRKIAPAPTRTSDGTGTVLAVFGIAALAAAVGTPIYFATRPAPIITQPLS